MALGWKMLQIAQRTGLQLAVVRHLLRLGLNCDTYGHSTVRKSYAHGTRTRDAVDEERKERGIMCKGGVDTFANMTPIRAPAEKA